jgi:hypothetical protein
MTLDTAKLRWDPASEGVNNHHEEARAMSSQLKGRTRVAVDGAFLSVPAAFEGAPEGLIHSFKLSVVPVTSIEQAPGQGSRQTFDTHVHASRALLDFAAVDMADIDLSRVGRDCELVMRAIRDHPDTVSSALEAVCGDKQSNENIDYVAAELSRIGLTEQSMLEEGGGIIPLLLVAGACLLIAGCEHIQHPIAPEPQVPHTPDAGPTHTPDAGPPH